MVEQLKHECGVALVRLLKPQSYYEQKYGTQSYGLNKLYLMMEKQHNRGQEGAGIACVNMNAPVGTEYMFRERAQGKDAMREGRAGAQQANVVRSPPLREGCPKGEVGLVGRGPLFSWAISAIPQRARTAYSMCIPSCAATTGGRRTSV